METKFQAQEDLPRRYLKPLMPLGIRRSISLEDTSLLEGKPLHPTFSSSLQYLCVQFRPHQLLDEFNENIAQSDREHKFDWWRTVSHLRPMVQKLILDEELDSHFSCDANKIDKVFIEFNQSKQTGRRNAICSAIDRLYFNEQLILFAAITNDVQIEFNLTSSGFNV